MFSPSLIKFQPSAWNTPQTVLMKALPDNTVEGFKNYIVKFQTLSVGRCKSCAVSAWKRRISAIWNYKYDKLLTNFACNFTVRPYIWADEQFNLFIDEVAVLEVGVTDADAANITITRGLTYSTNQFFETGEPVGYTIELSSRQGLADIACHVILHTLNPRFLRSMTSYEAVCNIYQAHCPPRPTHFEPLLLELNSIL
jgi:hypothetical protein